MQVVATTSVQQPVLLVRQKQVKCGRADRPKGKMQMLLWMLTLTLDANLTNPKYLYLVTLSVTSADEIRR